MEEKLVELVQVTEWRDGCVYKTKTIGEVWVPVNTKMYEINDNKQYCTLGTKRMKELNFEIYRNIK